MFGLIWWIIAGLAIGAALAWTVIDDWIKTHAQIGDVVELTKRIKHCLDTNSDVTVVRANIFRSGTTKEFEATRLADDLQEKFGYSDKYIYTVRG